MRKLFLLLSVVLSLSCSKNHRNSCDGGVCPAPTLAPLQDVIAEDNWQFSLPGSGWKSVEGTNDTIKVIFNNQQLQTTVLLNKEATDLSFPDYVVGSLRSSQNVGIKVESLRTTTIDNTRAVVSTIRYSNKLVWLWILKKGDYAYAFSCGVEDHPDASTQQFELCESIAQSVQIK